jgi:hypothetical protein
MRKILGFTVAVTLLAAGCAAPSSEAEGVALRYGIQAGDSFIYRNTLATSMTSELEGLPIPNVPDDPIDVSLDVALTTSYLVADGPEPGSYAVTIGVDELQDLAMTVRSGDDVTTFSDDDLGGELDLSELPMPGTDVEFIVDSAGHIVSVVIDGIDAPFPGLGGQSAGAFSHQMPFLGPEMPEGPVAVGDTWSSEWSVDLYPGTTMKTSAQSRLVALETLDGIEVHVIETTTAAEPVTVDLAGLLGSFGGEGSGALPAGLEMTMTMRPAPSASTVWFDAERGVTVRQEFSGGSDVTMAFAGGGESGSVSVHVTTEGTLELID